MSQNAVSSRTTPAVIPVDTTAVAVPGMRGVPVFSFTHRGTQLGRATGWGGHAQFAATVANTRNTSAALLIASSCRAVRPKRMARALPHAAQAMTAALAAARRLF
ncbi:hypothetical protein ACUXPM_001596 [Ralstonia sp. 151470066-2]|jgi:hypothetical protein|uniref:hypothetical protein n=1 Tax=Ralstonia TaxID=48736 RepID=UPI0006649C5E|nr:hypothetical protein AC240_20185 [Ralstonia sp. MD27]